ncbi:MAG TPA: hypothetical protein VIH52_00710 [Candidatus Nanoarchaeia archaeon]
MPAKRESIEDLKKQLSNLQEKIADYEFPQPRLVEVKELYSWKSAERLFIPRNRKWFTYVIVLVLVLTLILLFLRQFIIIAPILAIAFVAYVLASVPPEPAEHKLTTQGLNSGGHSYLWEELADFWFIEKYGETLIHIDTYLHFPRRLILILGKGDKEKIKEAMLQYLPFREIPKTTWVDRLADFLSNNFHKIAS